MSKPASAKDAPYAAGSSHLVHDLGAALSAANAFITEQLAREGISGLVPSHGDILISLFHDEPASMQRLSASCGRDPSTVTALVKKLEAAGYVEVTTCPTDKRSRYVTLTDAGRALEPAFDRISARLRKALSVGLTDEQLEELSDRLHIIEENFRRFYE